MTKFYSTLKTALAVGASLSLSCAAYAAYPAAGDFDGSYAFKAEQFTLNDEQYADIFQADFVFQIATDKGAVKINDLMYTGQSFDCLYDEATGVLTLKTNVFQPIFSGTWMGFAPLDGGWQGMYTNSAANLLKLQIGENGSVSVPDFDVVTYYLTEVKATIAKYGNIQVTLDDNGGGGSDPGAGDDDGDDVPDGTYAYMEGVWSFDKIYSFASGSLVKNDEGNSPIYNATVKGSTITFKDNGSDNYNMVAKIIDDTTLEFRFEAVGNPAIYTCYQCPFVGGITIANWLDSSTFDKDFTFRAVYDLDSKTLTFPEGAGFRYGFFSSMGQLSFFEEAIEIQSKGVWSEFKPQIIISNLNSLEVEANTVTVYMDVQTRWYDSEIVEYYKIQFNERQVNPDVQADLPDIIHLVEATVADGVATASLPDMEAGSYSFGVSLIAYSADDEVYATSNMKDTTIDITGEGSGNPEDSGVTGVEADVNGPVRYFNLQGVEVANPTAGQILIKVEGNKAVKIIK